MAGQIQIDAMLHYHSGFYLPLLSTFISLLLTFLIKKVKAEAKLQND